MSLTVSSAKDIITPIGNQLAIFIDNQTNKLSLKDIYNQTQEVFSGEVGFDRLVLNPIGSITAPVPDTAILLIAKESDDNSIQINVNRKVSLSGDGGAGTLNYMEVSEIESSAVFTGTSAQIVHEQARAEFKGEGAIFQLTNYSGSTKLDGANDKTVDLNYGHLSRVYIDGTGNDNINFAIGYYSSLNGGNDNATIEDYYGYSSQDFTTGAMEITDSYTSFASFGLTNSSLTVNEYIGFYHTSSQPTLATDNYFMKNVVDMPLDTVGAVISKEYSVKALNSAPSSASDTGTTGEIRFTSDAIYLCTATDTWKKAEITTF